MIFWTFKGHWISESDLYFNLALTIRRQNDVETYEIQ